MTKPELNTFKYLSDIDLQPYERYLPTAFDSGMTQLQKLNKIIQYCKDVGVLTNDVVSKWNEVMEWVENEGVKESVIEKIVEMFNDGTLTTIINEEVFTSLNNKTLNKVALVDYEHLKLGNDWTPALIEAANVAKPLGATIIIPQGVHTYTQEWVIPDGVEVEGSGNSPDDTVLNFLPPEPTMNTFAIKTGGNHERNKFRKFRLQLNNMASGIKIGDYYLQLPVGQVPTDFELEHIAITDIGAGYTGLTFVNASHYTCHGLRIGYGATSGRGCYIYADHYNSGVCKFTDCSLGRLGTNNENSVGLEIDGTVNLDGYSFDNSCYYGGKTPIRIGSPNTFIRNIDVQGHAEGRNFADANATVHIVELCNVLGGTINLTFAGFKKPNTYCVAFKGEIAKVDVLGREANGIMKAIFKNNGVSIMEDCMLRPPRATNNNGVLPDEYEGELPDTNYFFERRFLKTKNIASKYYFSHDKLNKIDWGAWAPTNDPVPEGGTPLGYTKGDFRHNTMPTDLGTAGSKYTIIGWQCVTTGSPGVWRECRVLTGL